MKRKGPFATRGKGAFCYKEERKRGKREQTELLMKSRKGRRMRKQKRSFSATKRKGAFCYSEKRSFSRQRKKEAGEERSF